MAHTVWSMRVTAVAFPRATSGRKEYRRQLQKQRKITARKLVRDRQRVAELREVLAGARADLAKLRDRLFSSNVRLTVALTRLSLQSLQPGLQALPEEVEAAHSQSDNVRNAVEEMAETVSQLEENLEEAMIDVGLTEVHALSLALSARQLSQTRRRTKRVFRPRITKTEGAGAD